MTINPDFNLIESIIENVQLVFTSYYNIPSYIWFIALWILFFRDKLKYPVAVTAAGLFLENIFDITLGLIWFDMFFSLPEPLIFTVSWEFLDIFVIYVIKFFWYTFFLRERGGKPLLVFTLMFAMSGISGSLYWLLDAGLRALGLGAASALRAIMLDAVILGLLGLLLYRLLSPRLLRTQPQSVSYIWIFPAVYYVTRRSVWFFFIGMYFDAHELPPDPRDTLYLFVTAVFIILFCLVFALILLILDNIANNAQLKSEGKLKDRLIDMQREQYERLMEYAEKEKVERHDRRHHIAAVWQLADAEGSKKIKAYVENLQSGLTAADRQTYCKNYAVSAVAAYYLGLAIKEGVDVDARFEIPEDTGSVPAMDLCVVMGNLLENAVEACRRMESENRFIRVRSRIEEDTLSIVVTNSFDGVWREKGGAYLSRKDEPCITHGNGSGAPHREGIGLPSISAVCENHGGLMECEIAGDVWKSAALVHM